MLIIAQSAAIDDAGQKVQLLVIGLLVVAVLLGALTIWYWRHTDPKRRAAAERAAAGRTDLAGTSSTPTPPAQASAASPAVSAAFAPSVAAQPAGMATPTVGVPLDADDDDWLSLTGPEALPRSDQS